MISSSNNTLPTIQSTKKQLTKNRFAKLFIFLFAIITLLITQITMATETPKYTVTQTDGKIELRTYAPKIVAETLVSTNYENAGSEGFRILADYIFGNNTAVSNKTDETAKVQNETQNPASEKIAMTAPVIRTKAPNNNEESSQKIAMTAPVSQSEEKETANEQWRIQFVMPSKYTLQTLPTPNNNQVNIKQTPETNYAVIRFSGLSKKTQVDKKTEELLDWMKLKGLTPKGEPSLARYDPPWTPRFLRRNEVMIEY